MGTYDTAQICTNGHVITTMASASEFLVDHCSQCGAPTTTVCARCEAPIRGDYQIPGVLVGGYMSAPAPRFCYKCGQPYPWTEQRIVAAKELAGELEDLSPEERDLLSRTLDDIVRDTPRTDLAVTRVKKLSAKLKGGGAGVLMDVLKTIATEAAKKALGL